MSPFNHPDITIEGIEETPFRTWMIDQIAGAMNLVSDCVCNDDEDGAITWRDRLRWFLEGYLSSVFSYFYEGSADEIIAAVGGELPPRYWNDRQRAAVWDLLEREAFCHTGWCRWEGLYPSHDDHRCPSCGNESLNLR